MKPRIGLSTSLRQTGPAEGRLQLCLNTAYTDAVLAAGGIPLPLPIPPAPCDELISELLSCVDAIIFTGGHDLHPGLYGQSLHPRTEPMHERRQQFEIALFKRADELHLPILAICLGHQLAYVARGGGLIQHVDDLNLKPPVVHHADSAQAFHDVHIDAHSHLARLLGCTELSVNSRHHQIVDAAKAARGLKPVAFSADGVIEATEDFSDGRFLLTVQWHPEDLIDRPEHLRLFQVLISEAQRRRPARGRQ
jgi:putative glutamine amidotransferase